VHIGTQGLLSETVALKDFVGKEILWKKYPLFEKEAAKYGTQHTQMISIGTIQKA